MNTRDYDIPHYLVQYEINGEVRDAAATYDYKDAKRCMIVLLINIINLIHLLKHVFMIISKKRI